LVIFDLETGAHFDWLRWLASIDWHSWNFQLWNGAETKNQQVISSISTFINGKACFKYVNNYL